MDIQLIFKIQKAMQPISKNALQDGSLSYSACQNNHAKSDTCKIGRLNNRTAQKSNNRHARFSGSF